MYAVPFCSLIRLHAWGGEKEGMPDSLFASSCARPLLLRSRNARKSRWTSSQLANRV